MVEAIRNRKLPLVGDGGGVWSFIHIEDAADATVSAIEGVGAGSTTSWTTSRRRSPSGCRAASAVDAPAPRKCRGGSHGCSRARRRR